MTTRAPCCGRVCAEFELVTPTPALRRLLDAVPAGVARTVRVDVTADQLCGNCVQQLMRRHRALGGRAVVPRALVAKTMTGRNPGALRRRWSHDAIDEVRDAHARTG